MALAMKRPAAAAPAGPPRKRAAKDRTPALCASVSEALAASALPKSVKSLLAKSVINSVGPLADTRHEYQMTFVGMIGEAMQGILDNLEKERAALQCKIESTDAEKASRDAAETAAAEVAISTKIKTAERKSALGASSAALTEAKTALKDAEVEEKSGNAVLAGSNSRKEALEAAQAKLAAMKEAAGSAADVKLVLAVAKSAGCEENLLKTVPDVLKKAPAARGTFAGIAYTELEKTINTALAQVNETLVQAEPSKAARAEAVVEAKAVLDAASATVASDTTLLQEAVKTEKEAEHALQAAARSVKNFSSEVKATSKELKLATDAVRAFSNGPLAAFVEMRDRVTPSLAEEMPAPAEETPADDAAETQVECSVDAVEQVAEADAILATA